MTPAAAPLAGMVAGILAARWCPQPMAVMCAASAAGVTAWYFRRYRLSAALIFMAVAVILMSLRQPQSFSGHDGERRDYAAVVTAVRPVQSGSELTVDRIAISHDSVYMSMPRGQMKLNVIDDANREFLPGDIVRFSTSPVPDSSLFMPEPVERYDYPQGITVRGIVSGKDIRVIGDTRTAADRLRLRVRQQACDAIYRADFDDSTSAFLLATLLGDTSHIDSRTRGYFRNSGIAHLLAVSGLHVGIIAGLILLLLRPLRILRGGRPIYYASAITAIILYCYIVGPHPPVIRATIMLVVYLAVRWLQSNSYGWNSLAFSVIVMLFYNPLWLFSPGLQLSVGAVAGILGIAMPLTRNARGIDPALRTVRDWIAVTLGATLGTWILAVVYFHSLPLSFLPVNLIASVFAPAIMVSGALTAALAGCGIIIPAASTLTDFLYSLMDNAAKAFGTLQGATVAGLYPSWWQVIAAFGALTAFAIAIRVRGKIFAAIGAACLTIAALPFALPDDTPRDSHAVTDIRPGTVILVCHDDSAMLVCGGRSHIARAEQRYLSDMALDMCSDIRSLRHVKAVTVAPDTFDFGRHHRRGPFLQTESDVYYFASSNPDTIAPLPARVTHLIYENGFKGDPSRPLRLLRPDTVILSTSLRNARRQRIHRLLGDSIPVR